MRGRNQHLCFPSHKKVLCRDYSDYATLFNCIAQGIINTNSKLLSYSIMSNHVHLGAITDKSSGLVQRIRSSYTQMFNHKYGRKGQLGDPSYFQLNLEGRLHIAARRARLVRENNVIPKSLSFDRFGQISPADIVETDIVEGYFGSYRRLTSIFIESTTISGKKSNFLKIQTFHTLTCRPLSRSCQRTR